MEIMSEDDGGKHMTGRKRRHGDHHDEDDDDDDQHTAFDPDAMIGTQRCARFNDRDSSSGKNSNSMFGWESKFIRGRSTFEATSIVSPILSQSA